MPVSCSIPNSNWFKLRSVFVSLCLGKEEEEMLHELLLALLGYTGDLIIDEREHQKSLGIGLAPGAPISDEPTFKLAPDISFLQPSEKYRNNLILGHTRFFLCAFLFSL